MLTGGKRARAMSLGQTSRRAMANDRDGSKGGAPIWDMKPAPVFGRFPSGWLEYVLRQQYLGDVRRDDILHVCSGTLTERLTVDLRVEARPRIVANGMALPFKDGSFRAVLLDPPYEDDYAENLYGVKNPRPAWLLKEAARVLDGGGRIGFMHFLVPFSPPDCFLVNTYGISVGVGFKMKAFTVFQKKQTGLPLS